MPFNSRAYRVLIASPSDVEEEREIAVKVIQEWNDLHSYARGVVLLPLRWETHSAPEYGIRPQEVINRAIVDQCDLLIGIFWTKIGTPTGVADSGTLEEISRAAKAGKQIMLYFSKIGIDPELLDLAQVERLKAFKTETYPNALTESFKSQVDFRDKLARQLELKVRDLQKVDEAGGPPPLSLSIAAPDLKSLDGVKASRVVDGIDVEDWDVGLPADEKAAKDLRRSVDAHIKRAATVRVVLAISNTGASGIRNLYVELDITASTGVVVDSEAPQQPASLWSISSFLRAELEPYKWKGPGGTGWAIWGPDLGEGFQRTESGWRLTFEWPALQPNRQRWIIPLFVTASQDGMVNFRAKIFADSLAEPAILESALEVTIRRHKVRIADLLERKADASEG